MHAFGALKKLLGFDDGHDKAVIEDPAPGVLQRQGLVREAAGNVARGVGDARDVINTATDRMAPRYIDSPPYDAFKGSSDARGLPVNPAQGVQGAADNMPLQFAGQNPQDMYEGQNVNSAQMSDPGHQAPRFNYFQTQDPNSVLQGNNTLEELLQRNRRY